MGLDYEYGVNTGNRFIDFVDHDEDPDEFVATQIQSEDKSKKSTKDSKTVSSTTSKKTSAKTTTGSTANATANTTKADKENSSGKSTMNDQRKQQSSVLSDNNNQQIRIDSGRGSGRGSSRRGTGQDRPAYEGGGRGGGQQRSQRFQRFEGQQGSNEARNFEQSGDTSEGGNNNQRFGNYQGRGRGGDRGRGAPRGTFYNRQFEGGRGRGRGGRGGRGNFNNRSIDENSQQQQQQQPQTQNSNEWQPNTDETFDKNRSEPAKSSGQEFDVDQPTQERSFEPDGVHRGGRGHFRARTFRSNRNQGQDRQYQPDHEGGQEEYRHNRRRNDRQPRSFTSGVKAIEKKDGDGAHNWGNAVEIPDVEQIANEPDETTDQTIATPKNWSDQVDEAEKKQITLDEYKKQLDEKKRAQQEKIPQFNRRNAGEGEDQKNWQFKHEYRKKNDNEESQEELEEGSDAEEGENEEDEHASGKKKLVPIPLHFNAAESSRGGPFGSRGGPRRGGSRYRDRPYRDDQQRSKSPNQQQSPMSQHTGEYRGSSRQGSGRNEYRRPYGNPARGSRSGYNRSHANPNTPDFDNTVDFPTLPKQ